MDAQYQEEASRESGKEEVQTLLVSLGALVSQGEEKVGDAGFFKSPL